MSPIVHIGISDISHATMSGTDEQQILRNRSSFLLSQNISLEQSILVRLTYEGDDYCRFYEVSTEQAGDGMSFGSSIVSDALFTRSKHVALFLPIADCIAGVMYDPTTELLGLAHFGRHNLLQDGAKRVVEFSAELGCSTANLQVWLSPAAGRGSYPLYDFNNRSLHEVALEQLYSAGVSSENIFIDSRDTTNDQSLYSHSEFLKGRQQTDGRQAVVAMMRS